MSRIDRIISQECGCITEVVHPVLASVVLSYGDIMSGKSLVKQLPDGLYVAVTMGTASEPVKDH